MKLNYDSISSITKATPVTQSDTPSLAINSSGYVGIGTTAPSVKLQVGGVALDSYSILAEAAVGSARRIGNIDTPTEDTDAATKAYVDLAAASAGSSLWGGAVGSNMWSLNTGYNVGIGTTNPTLGLLQLEKSSGNDVDLALNQNGVAHWRIRNIATNGNLGIYNGQLDSIAMAIDKATGNVGIGTTAPSAKLQIGGVLAGSYSILAEMATTSARRIGNVATPVIDTDASTKGYVDSLLTDGTVSGGYLRLNGLDTMTGALKMGSNNITGVNKLTIDDASTEESSFPNLYVNKLRVTTIDPLYNLNGTNYSTFAASIAGGVKEEYVGKIKLHDKDEASGEYEAIIDFAKVKEGSDLWVWRQTVDFSRDNVEAVATPYGHPASVYYIIDGDRLIFRSDRAAEISYRLTGRRLDWREWPTKAEDQTVKGWDIKNR